MITLVLIRHAKSDWGQPSLGDHDRTLNPRGIRDAPAMASRLAATGLHPDAIVASTAVRAATTAGIFGEALGVKVRHEHRLYGAAPTVLLDVASTAGGESIVIVAHDPGLSMLASRLSDDAITAMPTCAIARFEWDAPDWASIDLDAPDRWSFDAPGLEESQLKA